jgi:hypothetical protein
VALEFVGELRDERHDFAQDAGRPCGGGQGPSAEVISKFLDAFTWD